MNTKLASLGIVAIMLIGGLSVVTAQNTSEEQAQDRILRFLEIAENSAQALQTYNDNQDIFNADAAELIEEARAYIASAYEFIDLGDCEAAVSESMEALTLLKEAAAMLDVPAETPATALVGQRNRLQASINVIGTINERLSERGYDNSVLKNFLGYANDTLDQATELINNGEYVKARIMLNELHVRRDTVQNAINNQATERIDQGQAKGFVNNLQKFYNNADQTINMAKGQGIDTEMAENMLANLTQRMQQALAMHQNGNNFMSLEKIRQAMVAAHNLSMEMQRLRGQISTL